MEIEIMSGLSELGFRLVRILLKYFDFLSHTPYLKYVAFGFGSFIVFIKDHINPRSWRKTKNLKKS
jgi:hypothetical protein